MDLSDELNKECLWYSFCGIIQQELDDVKEHWNTHYIRKSRFDCVSDWIFYIPGSYGGTEMKLEVEENKILNAMEETNDSEDENEFTEYFDYVTAELKIDASKTWDDALSVYHTLLKIARQGT